MKEPVRSTLMKHYDLIKRKYPDCLVLYRVGDFYETFGADAVSASQILGITLVRTPAKTAEFRELAGFPWQNLEFYLPRLVRAGRKVAICDSLDESSRKNLLKNI